jgi:hypothetical protein
MLHGARPSSTDNPWTELNELFGRSTRNFQNAVRTELGVSGPTKPWDRVEYDRKHEDAQQLGELGRGVTDRELPGLTAVTSRTEVHTRE